MADVIYAEPYALKGGVYYYGKTIEYSVAAYASRRLGFYHGVAGSTNENFINLLNAMVNYGTLAQKYFNYNVDNLMSDVVSAGKHATLTHIEALAPTCTEAGHAEYWQCECGQLFADADGKTTLDAIPTLAPLGHDYISGICSRCEDIELTDTKFFTFTLLSDNTYSVKANETYKSTLPKGVKVPAYYNDKPVTDISRSAFYGCSNLKIFIIPDRVTSIGSSAFFGCRNLTSITIPKGVTVIDYDTFYNCNLIKVNYLGSIESWCKINFKSYILSYVGKLFINGEETKNIVIPETITEVNSSFIFYNCGSLTSVSIESGITSIGYQAFYNCANLTSVTIGSGVTSIGSQAFSNCSNLTSVTISSGVTSIGSQAFSNCSNLTSVTIPDSVTTISNGAFSGCSSLTNINIPDSVTNIGRSAFSNCSGLTSLYIPDGVTYIGDTAFKDCSSLTSINIPNGVASIGDDTINRHRDFSFFLDSGAAFIVTPLL